MRATVEVTHGIERGALVHIAFDEMSEAQWTMVRPQEFYESPIHGIRGEVFSFETYCAANKVQNGGVYVYDWTGFNIPGHVVREFFARFTDLSHSERGLKMVMDMVGKGDFYLICTCKDDHDPDTFSHEVCHALWYLSPVYKAEMAGLLAKLKQEAAHLFAAFKEWLLNRGYDESVVDDECQAYLSTTPHDWWASDDAKGTPEFADAMWTAGTHFRGLINLSPWAKFIKPTVQ